MIGIMVDKIDLKQMEDPTDKWVDHLINNKSFYVSPTITPLFLNLSVASHGFLYHGVFWWDGEVSYRMSVGLSLFSLFSFFLFLFCFGCLFLRAGGRFFLFQPSII